MDNTIFPDDNSSNRNDSNPDALSNDMQSKSESAAATQITATGDKKNKSKNTLLLIICILATALVVGIATAAFFIIKDSNNKVSEDETNIVEEDRPQSEVLVDKLIKINEDFSDRLAYEQDRFFPNQQSVSQEKYDEFTKFMCDNMILTYLDKVTPVLADVLKGNSTYKYSKVKEVKDFRNQIILFYNNYIENSNTGKKYIDPLENKSEGDNK